MSSWLQSALYPQLQNQSFKNDNELYIFLVLQAALFFAVFMHFFILIIMFFAHIFPLALWSLCSIIIFAFLLLLMAKRKPYAFSGIVLAVSVILHTFVTIYIIGAGNYVILHLLLLMIMQVTIPYAPPAIRGAVLVVTGLSMIFVLYLQITATPLQTMGSMENIYAFFNVTMITIGITLEIVIGNLIKQVIAHSRKQELDELTTQANSDPLTGLYNRRYAQHLFHRIEHSDTDTPYCVALMDIDDFKSVNDHYGHASGDAVLQHLAGLMLQSLRKTDVLFRWGGEEFLLLLADTDLTSAYVISEKLRVIIENSIICTNGHHLNITVTIGLSMLEKGDLSKSLENSDVQLYVGKRNGKNQVVR